MTTGIVLVVFVPLGLLTLLVIERIGRVVGKVPALLEWLGPGGGLSLFLADKPTLRQLVPPDLGSEIAAAASAYGRDLVSAAKQSAMPAIRPNIPISSPFRPRG